MDYLKHVGIPLGLTIVKQYSSPSTYSTQGLQHGGAKKIKNTSPTPRFTFRTESPCPLPAFLEPSAHELRVLNSLHDN